MGLKRLLFLLLLNRQPLVRYETWDQYEMIIYGFETKL